MPNTQKTKKTLNFGDSNVNNENAENQTTTKKKIIVIKKSERNQNNQNKVRKPPKKKSPTKKGAKNQRRKSPKRNTSKRNHKNKPKKQQNEEIYAGSGYEKTPDPKQLKRPSISSPQPKTPSRTPSPNMHPQNLDQLFQMELQQNGSGVLQHSFSDPQLFRGSHDPQSFYSQQPTVVHPNLHQNGHLFQQNFSHSFVPQTNFSKVPSNVQPFFPSEAHSFAAPPNSDSDIQQHFSGAVFTADQLFGSSSFESSAQPFVPPEHFEFQHSVNFDEILSDL